MHKYALALAVTLFSVSPAAAHDTWVQTNTNLIRTGDVIHVDLMLGNHGNDHRDFKLASKIGLDNCTLDVLDPAGKKYDLKPRLVDVGYAPKEGFWTARFVAARPGLYTVGHTVDSLFHNQRTIKSGKTYFAVSDSLDDVPSIESGFEKPLGHAFELVPRTSPVTPMGPGQPITVQLLYHGKPMPNARVSFIPRGVTLSSDFDDRYERMTDAQGRATFTPTAGDYYLIAAHHLEPKQKGEGYKSTKYSATLTLYVPEICPCCGG
jgi:uncharacterized GH25 family protein